MDYRVIDDDLIEEIAEDAESTWLILDEHPVYKGFWQVQSLTNTFIYDFEELIGPHRVISPSELPEFLGIAKDLEYKVAFGSDPLRILESYEHLNDPPEVSINSTLEGTVNGLLPYQVQGYNALKDETGAFALWGTGTGKTVLSIALLKYRILKGSIDACLIFVQAHNKVNTARWFERLGDFQSYIVEGSKSQRESIYVDIFDAMDRGEIPVVILNYEKVRDDFCWYEQSKSTGEWMPRLRDAFEPLFDKRLMIIWDEASAKMKNRSSKLYKGVVKCLYRTNPPAVNWEMKRPPALYQIALTATPIEVDPEDYFNVERLLNGGKTLGTVQDFYSTYGAARDPNRPNKILAWRDLDDIALRSHSFTHLVDKRHPDIASQFPSVMEETYYIDWDEQDRKVYDKLTKELVKQVEEDEESINIFAAISVMQMLCDAPTMVNDSAALREAYERIVEDCEGNPMPEGSKAALTLIQNLGIKLTNDRHTKIKTLHEILTERHPTEKVLIYTTFNQRLLPIMETWLTDWQVPYVTYNGTPKQRQEAEDFFREDSNVRVFLSSDKGSDSLNLEMAQVGINYDLPWNDSRRTQRLGRNDRRTSEFDTVYWYDLIMADSVEDRKVKLNKKKRGYHDAITGRAKAESASARMTKGDLLSILTG